MFQFLNGAIVRKALAWVVKFRLRFQFLNGAIVSVPLKILRACPAKFQFLNGAIVSLHIAYPLQPLVIVSIPKWCDCKVTSNFICTVF